MANDESFDAAAEARTLLRTSLVGTLATLSHATGAPYASMAAVAPDVDGAPLMLLSTLAIHTTNLMADPRVSLLLDARTRDDGSADPMTRTRVSYSGTLAATGEEGARQRFLRHHPDAAFYSRFKDFAFYRLAIDSAHLVAGFGRIVDLLPADLLEPDARGGAIAAAEAEIVAHLNDDHADTLQLYARAFGGEESGFDAGAFTCVACDRDALTLRRAMSLVRIAFPRPVEAPGALRAVLARMADDARAALGKK
ncbi:MAG: DUF2470 domain-containing protein [Rhodobiaceae bacterium]|nr:DUF2470 domain-containing protein [Rhodobiaceae bacterium]MCC0015611.1 DUF2470 domain-containing protein [Rhodobiaceae bacterium]MCC0054197.1 DUF2470 domain-containing protein [Rhodobiaceae bacterium]